MSYYFVINCLLYFIFLPHNIYGQVFFGNNEEKTTFDESIFDDSILVDDSNSESLEIDSIKNALGLEPEISTRNIFGDVAPRAGQTCTSPRGRPGKCAYIFQPQCGNVLRAIRILGITRPVRNFILKAIQSPCGFEQFDYTLCCEDRNAPKPTTQRPTQKPTQKPTETTTTQKTTKKPVTFPTSKPTTKPTPKPTQKPTTQKPETFECGISNGLRIVGGEPATVGSWPWAAIVGRSSRNGRIIVHCGGTLINENYVLSAAHCFQRSNNPDLVRLGDLDINTNNEASHEDFPIQRIINHPEFSGTTLKNDIALLKLSRPVKFKAGIRPACLPEEYKGFTITNLKIQPTIIGWGSTDDNRPTEPILRQAKVPLIGISICDQKYDPVSKIKIGKTQICAGLGNKDTCSGDSGGPILSSELGKNNQWSVIGITSFGVKCGDSRFPGVYTRVDQYLDWIRRNTQSRRTAIQF